MDDEDTVIASIEQAPEGAPGGQIDTTEKLAKALAAVEPGKFLCLFQSDLPEMPDDEEDDREYLCCKIMRDSEGGPPPFWLIGLDVDEDKIKAAAQEIIENALGGKITHSGYPN